VVTEDSQGSNVLIGRAELNLAFLERVIFKSPIKDRTFHPLILNTHTHTHTCIHIL